MSGNLGPIVPPNLRTLFDTEGRALAVSINKIQVGIVQSFIPGQQKCTVQLVSKRVVFNTPMPGSQVPPTPTIYEYPVMVDVPVFVLSGGSAYIGMPVSAGDPCIVLFNDRDIDTYFTNGTVGATPNTGRAHSLSDGMALVGIRPFTKPVPGLPSDGSHMAIGNASGTLRQALDALMAALTAWVNTDSTTPNTATLMALAAVKVQFDALFQ